MTLKQTLTRILIVVVLGVSLPFAFTGYALKPPLVLLVGLFMAALAVAKRTGKWMIPVIISIGIMALYAGREYLPESEYWKLTDTRKYIVYEFKGRDRFFDAVSDGAHVYLSGSYASRLLKTDLNGRTLVEISAGMPSKLALTKDYLLANLWKDRTLAFYDKTKLNLVGTVALGFQPVELSVDESNGFAYPISDDEGRVGIVNLSTRKLVGTYRLSITTPDISYTVEPSGKSGETIVVNGFGEAARVVMRSGKVLDEQFTGLTAYGLAVGDGKIFVSNPLLSEISVLDEVTLKKIGKIDAVYGVRKLCFVTDSNLLVASSYITGEIYIYKRLKLAKTISLPKLTRQIRLIPARHMILISTAMGVYGLDIKMIESDIEKKIRQ